MNLIVSSCTENRTKRTPYCSSGLYGQTDRQTDTDKDRHRGEKQSERFTTCVREPFVNNLPLVGYTTCKQTVCRT
ncbi:hypothetical protein DPMN_165314 [Dreissena polymorpha]|uniref:Uncharacterized protein n=1 Tax=Dreissena polymorpha TaxID=45954 RepID=A0A9D4EUJ9_DREPO|nr:hypothetical protein DPMN_165314 [Dreissena polymorpha]